MAEIKICFPIPGLENKTPSSPYGIRTHPITKLLKMHKGVDIGAVKGTTIVSIKDGTVKAINQNSEKAGKITVVENDDGTTTRYLHQSKITVTNKQQLKAGEKIGEVGNTGVKSSGNHLHIDMKDKDGNFVNPAETLQKGRENIETCKVVDADDETKNERATYEQAIINSEKARRAAAQNNNNGGSGGDNTTPKSRGVTVPKDAGGTDLVPSDTNSGPQLAPIVLDLDGAVSLSGVVSHEPLPIISGAALGGDEVVIHSLSLSRVASSSPTQTILRVA